MLGRVRRTSLDGAGVVLAHLAELDLGDLHGVGAEDACDRQGEVGEACAVRSCLHALANSPPSMLLELYMPGIMIVGVVSSVVRRGGRRDGASSWFAAAAFDLALEFFR